MESEVMGGLLVTSVRTVVWRFGSLRVYLSQIVGGRPNACARRESKRDHHEPINAES